MALRDYTSHTRAIANAEIALRTDGPGDTSPPDNSTVISTNPKMSKKIKYECFTCRKLRIECSEERPTCENCRKSKRQCEGYSQRVIFKTPIENWSHHPGHVSTIQYHDPMLPDTLTSINNLALVLQAQGKYEEAEKLNRRALEGREKELGVHHLNTLTSINNLASVLQDQGKYEEAEKLNRRALEGYEKELGVHHLNTLTSVSNLAVVLRYQGKYEEAEKLNRRALEGMEKELGVRHPNTLMSVNNLALLLQYQGKYKEAEKLNRRALEGREKELGVYHLNTLTSINNLASVLQDQRKYEEAEKLNRRALEGREKKLGVHHPNTLTSVSNLAVVLRYQGKYKEAEKLNRRALEGREKKLGVYHPHTLTSVNNLAIVLQDQRKYEEAEKLNRRALESFQKELGVHHPDTLTSINNLAVVLKYQGKYEEAEKLNQRALEGREKELGVHHPDIRNQPLRWAEPNKQSQESPFRSIQPRQLSNYEFSHAKESFVERCPGCSEAWVQQALEPSAWSRISPVVSVRDPMQDLRLELDGDKLYKEWAERHSRCPLPSPQPKDHQMHDKGKPEQLNLTALKHSKDLSAVVQSTEPYSSESDHLDVVDGSSDDQDIDCLESIVAQKEHTLNKLMLCVYEIFTCTGSFTGHGNESIGSSDSIKRTGGSSTKASKDMGKKRSRDDKSEQSDGDDGKKESRKRPKPSDEINSPGCKTVKKFACPYYKRNPHGAHSSGACCGPGWDSVHRIKGHLYRVHAMPLHCRRCYTTFNNEAQLSDHSRSTDTCAKSDAKPPEGFDKDQERLLKGRKTMFQADSEEEKWKIIYLILFPDTALGELPSPYYDQDNDFSTNQVDGKSPRPPELKQFDAFLRRELPRTIRKTLEAALESTMGPIEETLKNELENIVRDAQDTLTRTYLSSMEPAGPSSGLLAGPSGEAQPMLPLSISNSEHYNSAQPTHPGTSVMSQFFVPPYATSESLPEMTHPVGNSNTGAVWSDSTYFSPTETAQNSVMDDIWLNSISSGFEKEDLLDADFAEDTTFGILGLDPSLEHHQPVEPEEPEEYTGKGKGRSRSA